MPQGRKLNGILIKQGKCFVTGIFGNPFMISLKYKESQNRPIFRQLLQIFFA